MSANEFKDKTEVKAEEVLKEVKAKNKTKRKKTRRKGRGSARVIAQIMNGEFLSKENFVNNLPFVFFLGFLLVVLISWGYYAETTTRKEIALERELGELNSEYFTLGSKYNTMRGRRQVAEKLRGSGVSESLVSPRKIKVKKYVFERD
ncbi:MAG: FtsL-like putative cell division protein [Crocinitomicaceae bacterium]